VLRLNQAPTRYRFATGLLEICSDRGGRSEQLIDDASYPWARRQLKREPRDRTRECERPVADVLVSLSSQQRVQGTRREKRGEITREQQRLSWRIATTATRKCRLHFEFCILNFGLTASQVLYQPQSFATSAAGIARR
jgi:hypothetical protein